MNPIQSSSRVSALNTQASAATSQARLAFQQHLQSLVQTPIVNRLLKAAPVATRAQAGAVLLAQVQRDVGVVSPATGITK